MKSDKAKVAVRREWLEGVAVGLRAAARAIENGETVWDMDPAKVIRNIAKVLDDTAAKEDAA